MKASIQRGETEVTLILSSVEARAIRDALKAIFVPSEQRLGITESLERLLPEDEFPPYWSTVRDGSLVRA